MSALSPKIQSPILEIDIQAVLATYHNHTRDLLITDTESDDHRYRRRGSPAMATYTSGNGRTDPHTTKTQGPDVQSQ